MARSFNGSSDYIQRTGLSTLNPPLTISAWFNVASLAAQRQIVSVGTGVEADYALLARTSGVIRARHAEASGLADSSSSSGTISTGVWNHGAAVFTSTTSRTVYLNGTAATTATNSIANANATQVNVGTRYSASSRIDYMNGSVGEIGVWNAALTADEITALSKGISPLLIRPQSLIDYVPLIGRDSPEIGFRGGSYTLTGTSNADHPRILMPNSVVVGVPFSAAPANKSGMFFAMA